MEVFGVGEGDFYSFAFWRERMCLLMLMLGLLSCSWWDVVDDRAGAAVGAAYRLYDVGFAGVGEGF